MPNSTSPGRARPATGILCVVGARPNFIKIAPIMAALNAPSCPLPAKLLHTGQHYDTAMNLRFFQDLDIPLPDINLEVGSASHAVQTADIMRRFEPVLDELRPAAVLVVGDVNSTIACALVAAKKGVPVVHVEAGLRSLDRSMPEEVNRVLTDQISDLLFTTERGAGENLLREGVAKRRIHFVGNVMIDTLQRNLERAVPAPQTLGAAGERLAGEDYGVLTLHRPSNVDDPHLLRTLLETMRAIGGTLPLAFPLHPRTRAQIERHGLEGLLARPNLFILPPLGYLQMLGLMRQARLVLTDSGGIQEETTALGVACITLRNSTERPVTVTEGTNTVVGQNRDRIWATVTDVLASGGKTGRVPELWDGRAAVRIATILRDWLESDAARRVA